MGIEIKELADAMGVHRNSISRLGPDKGSLTAPMAIKLAAALGNSPDFWLNVQHAVEIWDVLNKAYAKEARGAQRPIITRQKTPEPQITINFLC